MGRASGPAGSAMTGIATVTAAIITSTCAADPTATGAGPTENTA